MCFDDPLPKYCMPVCACMCVWISSYTCDHDAVLAFSPLDLSINIVSDIVLLFVPRSQ